MPNLASLKGVLSKRYLTKGKNRVSVFLGVLLGYLSAGGGVAPAYAADESFSIKQGALVGDFSLPLAEVPPALAAHAIIGDPSTQDLYVIGLLGDIIGNAVSGTQLRPVGLRYGRRLGRGDARIVVGPVDILPTLTSLSRGVALHGGVATAMAGTTLAVGLSTGSELYFLDARTLLPQNVATFGSSVSLAVSGLMPPLTKIGSVVGLGAKIYAADVTAPVVAQVDLMTGAVAACRVDAQVLGLSISNGQVVAATTKGTATLTTTCGMASSPSAGAPPMASSPLAMTMAPRLFELSERVLEMSFLNGASFNTLKSRRGLVVSVPGTMPVTVTVNNGTCQNTKCGAGGKKCQVTSRTSAAAVT